MARRRASAHTRAGERRPSTETVLAPALRSVLCVAAHPDDLEFTVAGTVARWAAEGRDVVFCLITTGGAGTNDHTPSADGLILRREAESREAARILGVKDVIFLGYEDGTLEPSIALRRELTRIIRRVRPDVVVTGDPTVRFYGNEYMNHPDHRAAASAALDAVFPSAETRAIFPELVAEGLEPHKVRQVWISGSLTPNAWVDVTATLQTKIAALRAHASQVGPGEWIEPLLRGWAARDGKRAGLALAEAFRRMVLS